MQTTEYHDIHSRAGQSLGTSSTAIYHMVAGALAKEGVRGETLIDVGCGAGHLWPFVRPCFKNYIGVDANRYDGFPNEAEFYLLNLEEAQTPLPDGSGDVVAAVETIEHLENPRGFVRELARLAKPGGWIVLTTPNQLSFLSKLTLVFKNRFNAFQDASYPAHLTALLEVDLVRMTRENGLLETKLSYSRQGRIPFTRWHFPGLFARLLPRAFSDNLLLMARKPRGTW